MLGIETFCLVSEDMINKKFVYMKILKHVQKISVNSILDVAFIFHF